MYELAKKYEILTKGEASKLSKFLRAEQGNLKNAMIMSGLSPLTLKRAAALLQIKNETALAIREKILGEI